MPLFQRRKNASSQDQQQNGESEQNGEAKQSKGGWRRPANTAFKQQRLKAWQPILTPKTVLPTLFIVGILFAPIGGLLLWGSGLVSQITIDYTNCDQQTAQADPANLQFSDVQHFQYRLRSKDSKATFSTPQWALVNNASTGTNQSTTQTCYLRYEVPADLDPSVFLYYKLTNFFQNHRRYVKSIDTNQLKGKFRSYSDINNGDCDPLDVIGNKSIYPCGLIANSYFNDTIVETVLLNTDGGGQTNQTYNFTESGIAWPGEAKKYAHAPGNPISDLVPPPGWEKRFPQGYTNDTPPPDLRADQHFQNWMRTAGLPTFTKLYARNDAETMVKGTYQTMIWTNFPVTPYGGTKSIVISTVSWMGGKNPFLGWAYIGASALLILLAVAGTIRHLIKPRRLGDMSMLSWNQPNQNAR